MIASSAKHLGCALLAGTAIGLCAPAFGQTAAPAVDVGPNAGSPQASSGNSAADIVVTANRREENAQRVPISINAIGGAALVTAGVNGLRDLKSVVPALNFTSNGPATNIFLRGIGFFGGNPNDEGSVATYIDGVYIADNTALNFSLNNIERVEVLKGPQSTLFGRNATAGVVQVITKDPSFTPSLHLEGGYGSYDSVFGSAYATAGLTNTLAVNFAAQGLDQMHGWGHDLTTGAPTFKQSNYSFRGKILYTPTSKLRILLSGDYADLRNPALWDQPAPGAVDALGQGYPGRYNSYGDFPNFAEAKPCGTSAKIEFDGGAVRVTSISSYRYNRNYFEFDQDASPLPILSAIFHSYTRTISQELQFSNGLGSPIQWIVGGYYYNNIGAFDPVAVRSGVIAPANYDIYGRQLTQSIAVYGQTTIPLTATTRLTGGLRYTFDDQRYSDTFAIPGTTVPLPHVGGPADGHQSVEKPTWRLTLDQQFTPEVLGYVSYNRGFKSGGYNLVALPGTIPPYQPEKVDAYEAGIKSTLLDRRLVLNAAGFYYDYRNIQIQLIEAGSVFIINGPKATIYGGEFDGSYKLSDRFTISGSASYLHARYGDFPNAPGVYPNTPPGGTPNADGDHLIFAPNWTYSVSVDYHIPTPIGNFSAAGSVYYNAGSFASIDNQLRNPSYYLVNATLGWRSPDGHYGVQVFGRNLANQYYYSDATESAAPIGNQVTAAEPRVFGVRLILDY